MLIFRAIQANRVRTCGEWGFNGGTTILKGGNIKGIILSMGEIKTDLNKATTKGQGVDELRDGVVDSDMHARGRL